MIVTGNSAHFGMKALKTLPPTYFPYRVLNLANWKIMLLTNAAGIVLMFFVDFLAIPRLVLALTINAAGAIGDIMVAGWPLTQPAAILIRDQGTAITLYREQQRAPGAGRTSSSHFSD